MTVNQATLPWGESDPAMPEPRLWERVLAAVAEAGEAGATCEEIAARLGVGQHQIAPRLFDLRAANRIAIRTKIRYRTRAGREAAIYVAVQS